MKRLERVVDGVYRLRLGFVNAFLLTRGEHWALIDCGFAGQASKIGAAIQQLGGDWERVRYVLVTHSHPDHVGSLAEIKRLATRARIYAHREEARHLRDGLAYSPERPLRPAPGLHNYVLYHGFLRHVGVRVTPVVVDCEVYDGQCLPIAGGVTVIHSPGHTLGHVCYLWHGGGGVLFAGDVAACLWGPTYSVAYEDFEQGKQTLCALGQHCFECICFGHGKSLLPKAQRRLHARFASDYPARLVPAAEGWAEAVVEV